jgi:hypothetical protein
MSRAGSVFGATLNEANTRQRPAINDLIAKKIFLLMQYINV